MRFHLQAVAALAFAAGSMAFAPAMTAPSRPASTELCMANNNNMDLSTAAKSLFTAGLLAVSTATTILPVEPVMAATAAPAKAEKVAVKKLASEEKEYIEAKNSLSAAQSSLKEYQKRSSDAKNADNKAVSAFKTQEKQYEKAKATMVAGSDKLSSAKNQKMPQSAVKELSDVSGMKWS